VCTDPTAEESEDAAVENQAAEYEKFKKKLALIKKDKDATEMEVCSLIDGAG
jgi:hypothetical protein